MRGPATAAVQAARDALRVVAPPSTDSPPWSETGDTLDLRLVAALIGLALAVRLVLLVHMTRTPYLEVDNIDARAYQLWAQQILDGAWLPERHFYQSPLYAYFLAAFYALFGHSPWPMRVLQVALGCASVGLVAVIGARVFGRRVGLLAGGILALYGPMMLEEVTLSKTSLLVFGALLGFVLFLRALDRRDRLVIAAAGWVFGVTVIGVGQWLPALLGLAAYVALDRDTPPAVRKPLAAFFLAGALVSLGPIVIWNSYWGGGLMLTSGDAGLNLYLGNNPLTTGLTGRPKGLRDVPEYEEEDSRRLAEREAGHALNPAEVSRHWSGRAAAWALAHPMTFVTTTFKKVTVLWNSYEIPDSYHYAFVRAHFIPWLWALIPFAVVGPLALVGLVLVAGHNPARPLYVVCLGYLGVIALFYVRSRYRMPAVPFLVIFAAAAIDWTIGAAGRRAWGAVIAAAVALLATGFFVNHAYCEPARSNAPAICLSGDVWFDLEWQKLAEWHERRGDLEAAVAHLHRAAGGASLRGPGSLQFWIGRDELKLAERAIETGNQAAAAPRLSAAAAAFERALDYSYRPSDSRAQLARVRQLQGRPE